MKISGIVKQITPLETGNGAKGTWTKFSYIIEENKEKFPDQYKVEAFNKEREANIGDFVNCDVNCRVNEYQGKYYSSMGLYKLDVIQSNVSAQTTPQQTEQNEGSGGLPF